LLADDETTRPTHHQKLRVARARGVEENLLEELMPWLLQARIPADIEVRAALQARVCDYVPAPDSQLNHDSVRNAAPTAPDAEQPKTATGGR